MFNDLKEIANTLNQASSVYVLSHFNPDPDAIGSSCALKLALEQQGKQVTLLNETPFIAKYGFVPGYKDVTDKVEHAPECLVVCDCGDSSRIGDAFATLLTSTNVVINIDHHSSNEGFGHLNLVFSEASSTCEIVYEVLKEMGVTITADIATCLLTGIIGDTGSFRYSSTSSKAHRIAAELMDLGADNNLICNALYGSRSLAEIRLEAYLLSHMVFHCGGKVVELTASKEVFEKVGATPQDGEGMAETARCIQGVLVSAYLREDGGLWRVSLRSKEPSLNISSVAEMFGGGGHRSAAAFRSRLPLEEIRSKLFPAIERVIKGA